MKRILTQSDAIPTGRTVSQRRLQSRFLRILQELALVAGILAVMSLCSLSAQVYEVEGTLKYSVGEEKASQFTRNYVVSVSNCTWAIRLSSEDFDGIEYYHVAYQAGSIFYYTRLGKLPPGAKFANKGTAVVEAGEVPGENGSFANYVWAALASSCYFGQRTNNEVRPLWLVSDRSYTVRASIELLDAYPFLPQRITYYQKADLLPPPFAGGWKAAVIEVAGTTNVGGITVPLDFTYQQYKPKAQAKTAADLENQFQVSVAVKRISLTPSLSPAPPQADGITLVGERRVGANEVTYATSNAVLPGVPDKVAVERARMIAEVSKATAPTAAKTIQRVVVASIFLISIGALALIVFRKHKHSP